MVVSRPAAAVGAALRLHAATATLPIEDLVETRVLLESASVAALARRVAAEGDGVLARPRALLVRMDDAGLPAGEFHALDSAFHVALADAAGNVVVASVMAALREAIEGYVLRLVPALPRWEATAQQLRAEHEAVLGAVARGDAAEAAALVERHIRGFFERAAPTR